MNERGGTKARPRRASVIALRVVLFYAVLSALWILFSEALLVAFVHDEAQRNVISIAKGWAFTAVTAALLYTAVRAYLARIDAEERTALATARRLGLVLDTAPAGIIMIDADGRYSLMNHLAARILGASLADVIGQPYDADAIRFEGFDGHRLLPEERVFSLVMASGEPVYGVRYFAVTPDGTRRLLSGSAAPLRDESGAISAVLLAFSDVTERYEAERSVEHLNRIYSMLSQANKAIIRIGDVEELYAEACAIAVEYGRFRMAWLGLVDEETGDVRPVAHAGAEEDYLASIVITTRDDETGHGPVGTAARTGRTTISNDIAQDPNMGPWKAGALARGYGAVGAFPLKDEGHVYGVLAIYAAEPGFFDAEETRLLEDLTEDIDFGVRHIRQDAELRRTSAVLSEEVAGKNALLGQLNDDIAERRRVEQALREANAALDALVESSPLPIVAMDDQARIILWNHAAERVFGWRAEEVIGRTSPGLPEESLAQQRQLLDVLLNGGRLEAFDQRLPASDGRWVDISLSAAPVVTEDGPARMAVAIFQDVTQRKQIEQLKADFISTVSHELRTPLTTIVGYSAMMRDLQAAVDPPRRREMAGRIHEKAIELQRLLEQLLEAASIQAGSTRLSIVRTDMAEWLQAILDEAIIPADITVSLQVDDGLNDVCVDRARLASAVGSLLSNAFKYSPQGGPVRVAARDEGERLVISVADEGVGIGPEQMDDIFDLFRQGDMSSTRAFGGLGLGLYMAKQVVEAHGGTIRVESEPGAGSTFFIDIPLVHAC